MFFLAQAEYSYLSADFRLKILLYFSPKKRIYYNDTFFTAWVISFFRDVYCMYCSSKSFIEHLAIPSAGIFRFV